MTLKRGQVTGLVPDSRARKRVAARVVPGSCDYRRRRGQVAGDAEDVYDARGESLFRRDPDPAGSKPR